MDGICLHATATLVSSRLNVSASLYCAPLQVKTERLGYIVLTVIKRSNSLKCNIFDELIDKHLKLTCGIVCTISDAYYLRVSPSEVQWITPEIGVIYQVISNTDWVIE